MADNKEIRFIDTTLRDGNLSLWASNMKTAMILPILDNLEQAGYQAVELVSSSFFKKMVRELKDDPWARLRMVAERLEKTPIRMMASRINTFNFDPPAMFRRFLELMAENGLKEIRILDPWNDPEGFRWRVEMANACGLVPIISITYSVSPRHTDAYFAERVKAAAALPAARLCFKDPGGLLTPERTRALVPIFLANAGAKPVELHLHCTTGLGPHCVLEAIRLGIRSVDTAIPPLANASSQPSIFSIAANARALGFTPLIDEDAIRPISDHFHAIAEREGFPKGRPVEYDHAQFLHQIPGGMISNLRHQLSLVGLEDRMDEALAETGRVRAEFGYPIMVTPLSQFVGSQAVINVILGQRYKEVTDQVIEYALGRYGGEAVTAMDADIRDRILDRSRAREIAAVDLPDPTLDEMRQRFGAPGLADEELVLRWLTSKEDVAAMRRAGPPGADPTETQPFIRLVEALAKRRDCARIHIRKPGFALTLEKRGTA